VCVFSSLNHEQKKEENMKHSATFLFLLCAIVLLLFLFLRGPPKSAFPVETYPVTPSTPSGRGIRYVFPKVDWQHALHWLAHPMDLEGQDEVYQYTDQLRDILRKSPYSNYTLQTPGISWKTLSHAFEFVLIETATSPFDARADPADPADPSFQNQLDEAKRQPKAQTLGRTAEVQDVLVLPDRNTLFVVPTLHHCNRESSRNLATFMRGCGLMETRNVLRQTAIAAFRAMGMVGAGKNSEVWISSSSLGWVHILVSHSKPTYYVYDDRP
jgi:hypothetical protein